MTVFFFGGGVCMTVCDNIDGEPKKVGAHTRDIIYLDSGVRPQNDKGRI